MTINAMVFQVIIRKVVITKMTEGWDLQKQNKIQTVYTK